MDDGYTRMMFGRHAVSVGVNFIMQETEGGMILIGQSKCQNNPMLRFGAKKERTHVLVLGDMVLRPHLVMASDSFRGDGVTSLVKNGFVSPDRWLDGDLVLDAVGRINEIQKQRD